MSKKIWVRNPLKTDFTVHSELGGKGQDLTIPSMEMRCFPDYLAEHIIKHLADAVIFDRGLDNKYNQVIKSVKEEITPKI